MVTVDAYLAFCAALAALAAVPGPRVTVIVANALRHGARAGLLNVLGTQVGVAAWLGIAVLGLQSVIDAIGARFDLLRYAGAAYVIWLGVKLLRANVDLSAAQDQARPAGNFRARNFRARNFVVQGFFVILTIPKMLVLFGALIPGFLTRGGDAGAETLTLGLSFAVIAAAIDTGYALMAGQARSWVSCTKIRAIEVASGLCLALGGTGMALR